MRIIIILLGAILAAIVMLAYITPVNAASKTPKQELITAQLIANIQKSEPLKPDPTLNAAQIIWLAQLANCESDTKIHALNPADSNGKPSRGFLQFQDATFRSYTSIYNLDITATSTQQQIAEAQVEIVSRWILNPGAVKWESQFPACVKRLGLPPIQK